MSTDKPVVNIQVVSDVICPWCWIGKRNLEQAMDKLKAKYSFNVKWEPYLLKPDIPPEGKPRSTNINDPRLQHVVAAARAAGLAVTGAATTWPSTVSAHVLLEHVAGGRQTEVAERLFKAYFTDGDCLDERNLLDITRSLELDACAVQKSLQDPEAADRIKKKARSWSSQGIHGVPFFVINGTPAFSGAQEVNTFIHVIEKLASKGQE